MNYTEVDIKLNPYSQQIAEILTALLADMGFDSFTEKEDGLLAYIPTEKVSETELANFINSISLEVEISYDVHHIEDQNWNKKWESNFEPITVERFCRIRASFHSPDPEFTMELVIEPKMAFGTGHHQTTWLMIYEMFQIDIDNKAVLDMGCGTGILAIVAEKRGASSVTAIDNDRWAYENAIENAEKNSCNKIKTVLGDASALGSEKFDVILANINLNILVSDMPTYINNMNSGGLLIMSGILTDDIFKLTKTAKQQGLNITQSKSKNGWALLSTIKP
jgi:ribosomal protein L11 methyltransferase